jgi:hypothetical protein
VQRPLTGLHELGTSNGEPREQSRGSVAGKGSACLGGTGDIKSAPLTGD